MSGAILDLSKEAMPDGVSAEVCIIGSGSGGATAARLLAEAGHEVVVLEEGVISSVPNEPNVMPRCTTSSTWTGEGEPPTTFQ